MLIQIQCDKFMSYGKIREPIVFHKGLNAVLGDDNASNSIGKSTFLMILDFVFGGEDYIKKCTDVHENVKEHTINFTFEFENKRYHFARNTIDYKFVIPCDENYEPIPDTKKWSVKEYGDFLLEHYGITVDGLSWRSAISRFIRVFKRETNDEEKPLHSAKAQKVDAVIKDYLLLFNKYASVEAQIKQAEQAEDEKEAFRKAQAYKHIRGAKTQKEFNENKERIEELREMEQELADQSNQGLLDLDSVQARKLAELDDLRIRYRRERAIVQTQLNNLRREMISGKRSFKKNYSELERFFPGVDFKSIEQIESFHQQLSKVLTDEFKESERDLAAAYILLGNQIAALNDEIAEIKTIPNVLQAVLKEYAAITTELNNLIEANSNYLEFIRLKEVAADYANTRDLVIAAVLSDVENAINQQMREITYLLLKDITHTPPILRLEKLNKYVFKTPNDGGTGAQFRGVVTFDLANMAVSAIPFVVHDSVVLKHIEKKVITEIVKVYESQATIGKQVFMAFDMLDAYSKETSDVLRRNCVLELKPKEGALFGRVWNIEIGEDENE